MLTDKERILKQQENLNKLILMKVRKWRREKGAERTIGSRRDGMID
jgi:hypothetical protein